MIQRWIFVGLLVVSFLATATVAVTGDEEQTQNVPVDVELAHAATSSRFQPSDDMITPPVPPFYEEFESACPGLHLDAEPIPPFFDTHIGPIPNPEPFQVCPVLTDEAAERSKPWHPAP